VQFQEELDHLGDDFELDPEDDEDEARHEAQDRRVLTKALELKGQGKGKGSANNTKINSNKSKSNNEKGEDQGEGEGEKAEGGDDKKKKKKKKSRKRKMPNKSVYFKGTFKFKLNSLSFSINTT
jgi:hypothetical protein